MPIETFSYISSLDSSNPGGSDGILQGDDHIRGLKATLLASFPAISGPALVTHDRLTELQSGNLTGNFNVQGILACSTQIIGNGSCPTGMIADFLAVPSTGWLELNGQTVSRTTYADLYAMGLPGFGPGNGSTTFTLPDFTDRYRRQRGTNAVATTLANQNKTHTHTASTSVTVSAGGSHNHGGNTSTESAFHSHGITVNSGGAHNHGGVSGGESNDHTHAFTDDNVASGFGGGGPIASGGPYGPSSAADNTGGASAGHTHTIATEAAHSHTASATAQDTPHTHTIPTQADHTHTASGSTTVSADGGTESRPDTYVVITCIKT